MNRVFDWVESTDSSSAADSLETNIKDRLLKLQADNLYRSEFNLPELTASAEGLNTNITYAVAPFTPYRNIKEYRYGIQEFQEHLQVTPRRIIRPEVVLDGEGVSFGHLHYMALLPEKNNCPNELDIKTLLFPSTTYLNRHLRSSELPLEDSWLGILQDERKLSILDQLRRYFPSI